MERVSTGEAWLVTLVLLVIVFLVGVGCMPTQYDRPSRHQEWAVVADCHTDTECQELYGEQY